MQVSTFKVLAALWLWMAATLGGVLPFILKHKRKTPAAVPNADPSSPLLHSPNAASGQALLSPNEYVSSMKQSTYQPIRISTTTVASHPSASGVTSPYGALSDHAPVSHVVPSEPQPRVQKSPMNVDRLLSLGNMLSAGIFLGGGLLHLLAESNIAIQKAQKDWAGFLSSFPIAFFFCGFGFFMILTVEELTISFTARRERKKGEKAREKERAIKKNRKISSESESVIQIEQPKARRFSDPISAFSRIDGDQGKVLPPLSASLDSSRVPRQAQLLSMVAAVNIHESEIPTSSSGSSSRSSAGSATVGEPVSSSGSSTDEPASAPPAKSLSHHSKDKKKGERDLARNLVHGLTPRLALAPDALRSSRQQDDSACSSCTEEEDDDEEVENNGTTAMNDNRGLKSKPASDEKDVDEDEEDEEPCGPIQSFLDAAYDSPSPFPTLADSSRMARHQQHQKKKNRKKPRALRTKNTLINAIPSTSPPAAKQLTQPLLNGLDDVDDDLPPPLETGPASTKRSSSHQLGQHDSSCDSSSHSHSNGAVHAHDHHHHDSHEHFHKHLDDDKQLSVHAHEEGHGHGHGHGGEDGHSHFSIGNDTSYIVAYMLVLALSFHSIFEGLALGLQDDMPASVSIFLAILAHSPLAGFALGVSLVKSHTSRKMALSCLFLFTIMTPLGTILGLLLSYVLEGEKLNIVSASFQSFSAGTFLFVALEEIIPKEMAQKKDTAYKLFLAVLGFLLMALIKCFDTDDD